MAVEELDNGGTDHDPREDCGDEPVRKAEADLHKAEAELKQAEGDLELAEAELKAAEEHRHHEPLVEFEDVNSTETTEFHAAWGTKLTAGWDEAAKRLGEPRQPTDRLQTPEGKDLMPYLELTLRELEERKIITALKFQIVGPTGGA
jgi:hypothetical protein